MVSTTERLAYPAGGGAEGSDLRGSHPGEEETLASCLRALRGDMDLSSVCRKINYAVTPTGIRNIEDQVTRRPKDTTLRHLATAYSRTPEGEVTLYRHLLRLAGYEVIESSEGSISGPQTLAEAQLMARYRVMTAEERAAFDRLFEVVVQRLPQTG